MASARVWVEGRPFECIVKSLKNKNKYRLMFHERRMLLGRVTGYKGSNKNFTTVDSVTEAIDWFTNMAQKNTSNETDAEAALENVLRSLEEVDGVTVGKD